MGLPEDLAHLDATAQAELVHRGEVSAVELVEAAIERAERIDPALNAIIHPRFERARAEAAALVDLDAPFAGVPMVVKDLGCPIAGEPHHQGTRALRAVGYRAPVDAALYRRFRTAGLVAIGRTNTPEWGSTITTEPLASGPTRNPWDLGRSPGGSSGGSAAAVAAGIVPVGHGGDGGGSIRIPASACGLVGLKPSRARVSLAPDGGESWAGFTIDGAITRSVRDAAAVLDAVAGPEPGDPYAAPPFARPLAAEVGADPGHLRVGVLDHPLWSGSDGDPECAAAVASTARLLAELGHEVEPAWPAALEEDIRRGYTTVVAAWTAHDLAELEQLLGRAVGDDDLEPDNLRLAEIGRGVSAADYLRAVNGLHAWTRRVLAWWHGTGDDDGYDLLVTPTLAKPPPPLGVLSGPERNVRLYEYLQFTSQFNVTGQPAISLPLHWSADGLPVGVQLVAGSHREDVLVRVAAQLEAARPWAHRVPPVHA
jgi:amidase